MPKKGKDKANEAPVIDVDATQIPPASFEEAMGEEKPTDDEHLLASSTDVNLLQKEVVTLNNALVEANKKSEENWNRLVRKEADYQNLVRRSQEDKKKAEKYAVERFASSLLDVIDSLERGMECCQAPDVAPKDILEGLTLSQKAFLDCLQGFGIKAVDPMGESFDPTFHEALTTQESWDVAPNKVLTVIQKGYTMHERLLRPARVIVAKAPKEESAIDKK
jgi:molecular chaperone GrpE